MYLQIIDNYNLAVFTHIILFYELTTKANKNDNTLCKYMKVKKRSFDNAIKII